MNGFTRLEGVVAVILIALLVAFILPAFTGTIHGGYVAYLFRGEEIAQGVMAYAADHNGQFPEAWSNANEAYEQLFPDYVSSKRVFVPRRSPWTPNYPDEASLERPGLAPGENSFAYVRGLNSESNPEFPLVAQGFREGNPGVYAFDPQRKGGVGSERRAVVIRVDGSARMEKVTRWDFRVYKKIGFLRKMDIFAPGPGWLAPEQRPLNPALLVAGIERCESITMMTRNGWILSVYRDGSAKLQYGSVVGDEARCAVGTFSFKEVYDSLVRDLNKSGEGGSIPVVFRDSGDDGTRVHDIAFESVKSFLRWGAAAAGRPVEEARFETLLKEYPVDADEMKK